MQQPHWAVALRRWDTAPLTGTAWEAQTGRSLGPAAQPTALLFTPRVLRPVSASPIEKPTKRKTPPLFLDRPVRASETKRLARHSAKP